MEVETSFELTGMIWLAIAIWEPSRDVTKREIWDEVWMRGTYSDLGCNYCEAY